MAYVPKIFKDRAVEFPFRRLLTPVSGQANTVDVSRVPGTIFEVGDEPDAANLNAEFGKIKTETDAINTSLNGLDADFTNKFAYISGTIVVGATVNVAYPSGFTRENTIITGGVVGSSSFPYYSISQSVLYYCQATLTDTYITISSTSSTASGAFKIGLMRSDI